MGNILSDPLISVRLSGGSLVQQSLPEVYADMKADRVASFPALRPHQRHAWHAFLAQLAVIAVHRAGQDAPPDTPEEWRALLRNLTSEHADDEPWSLVVEDVKQPAFMQCPVPSRLEDYQKKVTSPDDLDILVTSKNHDVKQTIASNGTPEDWMFALISLQTMAGYLGSGNRGIARMNGGHSARPCLGLAPANRGTGAHLFYDVQRMLTGRKALLSGRYYTDQGPALLWLEPWDGKKSADLRDLDPYFIEICRRVRLLEENGAIIAKKTGSEKSRVHAKEALGDLDDFWTPVNITDSDKIKALSVSKTGFHYKLLAELVLDHTKYRQPPSMQVNGSEYDRWKLIVRSLAGGQGKTEGYHERTDITFRPKTARALIPTAETDGEETPDKILATISKDQLGEIKAVSSALRNGVAVIASSGKDEVSKTDYEQAVPFTRRIDVFADTCFFSALEDRFLAKDGKERKARRVEFVQKLITEAESLLNEAMESVPCSSIYRHRAQARASRAFWGSLRRRAGIFSDQPEIFEAKPKEARHAG